MSEIVWGESGLSSNQLGLWLFIEPRALRKRVEGPQLQRCKYSCSPSSAPTPSKQRPNFVFVISDDLRVFDLSDDGNNSASYASSTVSTRRLHPNLLRFAKESVVFTNAHAQMAMCNPSRSSLLSGLRPDTLGQYTMTSRLRGGRVAVETIGEALKNAGYETFAFGKVLDPRASLPEGSQDYPLSWSEYPVIEKEVVHERNVSLTDCGYGDPLVDSVRNTYPFAQCLASTELNDSSPLGSRSTVLTDERRLAAALNKINALAEQHAANSSSPPFFLAFGFKRPHLPFVVPQRYYALFNRSEFPFDMKISGNRYSVLNRGVSQNIEPRRYTDWVQYRRGTMYPTPAVHSQFVHGYYAASAYVDELFGILVDRVRSHDSLVNNTVFVFFSDHGFHLGDHQFYGKHTVYESSTAVPLLFFGPERYLPARNRVIHTPVELVDIAPTIYELAGVRPWLSHDGESLVPLLRAENPAQRVKTVALSQFTDRRLPTSEKMFYGMRSDRYRYVVHVLRKRRVIIHCELYDLKNDPMERVNVRFYRKYAQVTATFNSLIQLYLRDPDMYKLAIRSAGLGLL